MQWGNVGMAQIMSICLTKAPTYASIRYVQDVLAPSSTLLALTSLAGLSEAPEKYPTFC